MPIFYVNAIMLTDETESPFSFTKMNDCQDVGFMNGTKILHIVLQEKWHFYLHGVNIIYSMQGFVQLNDAVPAFPSCPQF